MLISSINQYLLLNLTVNFRMKLKVCVTLCQHPNPRLLFAQSKFQVNFVWWRIHFRSIYISRNPPTDTRRSGIDDNFSKAVLVGTSDDKVGNEKKDQLKSIQSNGKPICKHCRHKFSSFQKLRNHTEKKCQERRDRRNETVDNLKCRICEKMMRNKSLLKRHLNEVHLKPNNYKCNECSETFLTMLNLDHHIRIVHKHSSQSEIKKPMCVNCNFRFSSNQKYMQHTEKKCQRRLKKSEALKCNICDKIMRYKSALERHMKKVHLKANDFNCEECEQTFSTKFNLNHHVRIIHIHSLEPEKKPTCEACNYTFSSFQKLRQHTEKKCQERRDRQNGILNIIKCDICEKIMKNNSLLRRHMNEVHMNPKNLECDLCDRTFSTEKLLNHHLTISHLKLKRPKCELCNYRFANNQKLMQHSAAQCQKRRDQQNGVYKELKCNVCDKRMRDKTNLEEHLNSVHLQVKKFKCDRCDMAFNRSQLLEGHLKNVHFKLKKFKCDECDYGTAFEYILNNHVKMVHEKSKKFSCELCDKEFFRKDHYNIHIESVHQNLKLYQCDICKKQFGCLASRIRHFKATHVLPIEDWKTIGYSIVTMWKPLKNFPNKFGHLTSHYIFCIVLKIVVFISFV